MDCLEFFAEFSDATSAMPIKLTQHQQAREARQQRCRLLELPLEVLIEVLILLDWYDLIHLRQVSHHCAMLSNLQSVYQIQ